MTGMTVMEDFDDWDNNIRMPGMTRDIYNLGQNC